MNSIRQKWFFLRGLVRETGHWNGFLESFSARFPNREAVALDLPGNGIHFERRSPFSVPEMAEFVRGEFQKKRGEHNFLVAVSLGAMVGFEWMHKHPKDLSGAVLINTSLRGLSPIYERLHPRNYFTILRLLFEKDKEKVEQEILRITSQRQQQNREIAHQWMEIQKQRPVSTKNALRQLLAAARFHPPTKKPEPPILLLNSLGDQLVSPRCSERIAQHWKVELRSHTTAGHDLTLDEPDWVLNQLEHFSFANL